ncbi:hypothetical protein [Thalassospira profundimaris]|uniref:hypothetical protein n=1 Tax=Thalassospira profundimaris TaxID=502049 RepID=UPI0002872D26|nr:hypothetical protein [Thalassospira profundimaris]EKF07950.1 hypothetical protein TH2_10619 [Thalassospira profundimaris WP0211]
MTGAWNDYNDAESQTSYDLIPKGTIVPVRMTIKPGGYDDPAQGWTGGYATHNDTTGSVYLNAEFVILEGPFAKRKVWSLIGLRSLKGPEWGNMGRSFVRGILNSSRGLSDKDNSPQAQAARRINGFTDLDGIEFLAKIDVGKDANGDPKNDIRFAVAPNHKDWDTFKSGGGLWTPSQSASAATAQPMPHANTETQPASNPNRPSWAQ